jgi:hypothetical protein
MGPPAAGLFPWVDLGSAAAALVRKVDTKETARAAPHRPTASIDDDEDPVRLVIDVGVESHGLGKPVPDDLFPEERVEQRSGVRMVGPTRSEYDVTRAVTAGTCVGVTGRHAVNSAGIKLR